MLKAKLRRKDLIKNKKDKRYIKTQSKFELAIGKFLDLGWISRLTTPRISNEAGVWASTFYDHYEHMDEAISAFSNKMEPGLRRLAKEADTIDGETKLEIIFSKILYFIYQNREYYKIILRLGYAKTLLRIIEPFWEIVEEGWSNYGESIRLKCFNLFAWEMCGILHYWGVSENFDFDMIGRHAKSLSNLAQNVPRRLTDCGL